jgi:Tfp pilus assembly protein PilF/glutathione synthase/RimK-type ligase-like ATP-grasp enzyme
MENASFQECPFCKQKIRKEAVKCLFCGKCLDDFEQAKRFFIEGMQFLEANNFQAAEIKFARSLEFVPDRVSTLNNLSAVKNKLKKFAESEEIARKAIALDDKSPEAWFNVGVALTATGRHEEALQAYERALDYNSASARTWLNKAMALFELKRHEEALVACDQALKLNPNHHKLLHSKSLILKALGRTDEAKMTYRMSLDRRVASSPVYMAERRATQKGDILVINHNPAPDDSLQSFASLHLNNCPNFPGQLAGRFQEDFHFTFVFEGDAAAPSDRKRIPQPDLVINNFSNGEVVLSEGKLTNMSALVDSFGVPVINHPTKVIQSTRVTSVKLLDNLSGVLVPKTMPFSSAGKTREELVREIEDQYNYPLITRTLAYQRGIGMAKADTRDALVEVLASGLPENFLVTEFVDSRGKNEFFRKIRAAIVKDEIIIVRADYDTYWNIHGRKSVERVPFYLEHLYLLEVERRICVNPEAELGKSAMQSLRKIRDRIPLDVFGVDFDVDADGRVVFYEANATMNLFSTAQKAVPNPKEAEDNLTLAFQRYLTSLVAHR